MIKEKSKNTEKKYDAMTIFCITILVIKVIWLIIHMNLHYAGVINPWKLGGYAMYTTPSPKYYALVETIESDNEAKIEDPLLLYLNLYARGGCFSGISKRFYKNILHHRPDFQVKDATIRLSFYKHQWSLKRKQNWSSEMGKVVIQTLEDNKLHIDETFCGKKRDMIINVR